MNTKIKQTIALFFTVMLLFVMVLPPLSAAADASPIKLGYYEDGDYMSKSQSGEYSGYNIEYLQKISKQSGLPFEMVDIASWNAAYDMLVKGEIDLLPAVYHSEQRAEEIFFSGQPMCSIYTTLNVRMNDPRYDYEDFKAFQGMNVGIIRGGVDGERFKSFCREHNLVLNIIDYDETSVLLEALDNGTLDGVAITHLGKNSTFRSVAQFSPSPLYFAVTKTNPELLSEINKAMNNILLANPGYSRDLYDKYLAPSVNQKPVFTKEELQYIKQAAPILVSYDPSFAPLTYQSKKSGQITGVTADIFEFIAKNSGLRFEFEAHNQTEALQLLQQGKISALALSDGDYLWDGRNNINSTLYYLRAPTSMITRYDSDKLEVIALPQGYQLSEAIKAANPHYTFKYYPSIEDCLNAVLHNKADAACTNTHVAGAYLSRSAYQGMRTITLAQPINEMCVGLSASGDPKLFSIINKCIQYLPTEQVDAYLVTHSANTKEVSMLEFIEQHLWQVGCIVILVLSIIILLIGSNLRNALRSNRRIQDLLYKDELTGLYNMNGFYQKWEENNTPSKQQSFVVLYNGFWKKKEENNPPQKQQSFVLLYSDICQFKFINDNFGFATGDQVLQASGKILQEILEDDEFCGRISSDHFALLLKYNCWEHLDKRMQNFVKKLNCWRKAKTDIPYKIDFVFGVCLIEKNATIDLHQKLDLANYSRRYAKDTPGSFIVLYDEKMRAQALLAQQLESRLDQALQENEFVVYYQPKVSMKDGSIIGSEALIRWNHPDKGFLMPGVFIPIFEKNGMVKKVDLWLFEEVCKTMRTWSEKGYPLFPVSCNFSRLHFQQSDFPARICEIADRWNVPHHLLELEITESVLLEESTTIAEVFQILKEMQFKIAIDDFGSGYSSLGQLQQLTADVLKLDRSFVSHGVAGMREKIVVGNVIHMAGELGMQVICEGVETQAQSITLQEIGCKYSQGFYFYRPMQLENYEQLLVADN